MQLKTWIISLVSNEDTLLDVLNSQHPNIPVVTGSQQLL